jgi:hypothetical protein
MNIIFSTPVNHHQIHMSAQDVSNLCDSLQMSCRIVFTRRIELGDADDMELIVDGDLFSDVFYVSVNGANMMVDGCRNEIAQKLIIGIKFNKDMTFDATDVYFKV